MAAKTNFETFSNDFEAISKHFRSNLAPKSFFFEFSLQFGSKITLFLTFRFNLTPKSSFFEFLLPFQPTRGASQPGGSIRRLLVPYFLSAHGPRRSSAVPVEAPRRPTRPAIGLSVLPWADRGPSAPIASSSAHGGSISPTFSLLSRLKPRPVAQFHCAAGGFPGRPNRPPGGPSAPIRAICEPPVPTRSPGLPGGSTYRLLAYYLASGRRTWRSSTAPVEALSRAQIDLLAVYWGHCGPIVSLRPQLRVLARPEAPVPDF